MTRDEFIAKLTKEFKKVGFKSENNYWIKQIAQPMQNITINGQPVQAPIITTDLKISIFADAEIDKNPAVQMLFEAVRNNQKILEYEEIFEYNIEDILNVLHQLFG